MYRHSAPHTIRDLILNTGSANCLLSNANVFSPDGRWIVYDVRSAALGEVFDGDRIERINIETGEVQVLYQSQHGAHIGVATYHPIDDAVIFIQGPEHPTPDWSYGFTHRQGVIVHANAPGIAHPLEARDLTPPFTAGALRGGTHVHMFSPDGQSVSYTYDDAVLPANGVATARNVGVSMYAETPVIVPKTHPRNRDGDWFSFLATRTVVNPKPGSDEIARATEEAWIGNGYLRADGTHQKRALAFQGTVALHDGSTINEVFIADLPLSVPVNLTLNRTMDLPMGVPMNVRTGSPDASARAGDAPLQGTDTTLPAPPAGTVQRRLTFTADRKFPGIHGPRHWLRSSPDGSQIAFLMRDDSGISQFWTISPTGGDPTQITHHPFPISSAFTWHPTLKSITYIADGSLFLVDAQTHTTHRVTDRAPSHQPLLPLACVYDPTGKQIAYVQRGNTPPVNRIRVCQLAE